jgi:hypothetical protein
MPGDDVIDVELGDAWCPEGDIRGCVFIHGIARRGVNEEESLAGKSEHSRGREIGKIAALAGIECGNAERSCRGREIAETGRALNLDLLSHAVIVVAANAKCGVFLNPFDTGTGFRAIID